MDTATLEISHTVFGVIDAETWPDEPRPANSNGPVIPLSRGALICTGIHSGAITVSVQALATAPTAPELRGWDEVVEVSFVAESDSVRVVALMDDASDDLPSLVAVAGSYRLRVHAKGSDTVGAMNRLHATRATGFHSGAGALEDAEYVEGDEDDDDPGLPLDHPVPLAMSDTLLRPRGVRSRA